MSTTRIKDKISAIVKSQLPEFVQTDYNTFVSFIEAYYRFLEQDQAAFELIQNSRSYNDIDKTVDSFVKYFVNTYARSIPEGSLADKKLLVKRIKDLYESKGSELSFRLLFNILFQTTVDVEYPYKNVLIASGGRWSQQNSIRVKTASGSINNILDRFLDYRLNGVDFSTPILRVKILSSTISELFLDPKLSAPTYTIGDLVSVSDTSGVIFTGTVDPTTASFRVTRGGSGFKVGQLYTINYNGGVGTLIRVSEVSSTGAVVKIKILNYGYNFPQQTFSIDLDPEKNISETVDILSDTTQGFSEIFEVSLYDPTSALRYFSEQYTDTNSYTQTFFNVYRSNTFSAATSTSTKPPNVATVQFSPGGLARYPGSYLTNDSFISEADIRIQNDLLYQPFAYQTVTSLDILDFYDVVTQLIHPAGQRLFNNRVLPSSIDVSANVSVISKSNVFSEAISVFDVLDTQSYVLSRTNNETQNIIENAFITVSKIVSDNTGVLDDNTALSVEQVFSDTTTISEVLGLVLYTFQDEVSNVIDQPALTINKLINNNISNVSLSETGIGTIQDYFAENYVSELYVGSTFTLI